MLATLITNRIASLIGPYIRIAVQRLGIGPVILAAAALAAALLSWRYHPRQQTNEDDDGGDAANDQQEQRAHRRRRRARPDAADVDYGTTSTARTIQSSSPSRQQQRSRKPQWLSKVRRVTIGAICSQAQASNMFTIDIDTSLATTLVQHHPSSSNNTSNSSGPALSPQEKYNNALTIVQVLPETIQAFHQFAQLFEVYLVIRVDTDSMEVAVTKALVDAGLFGDGLLDRRKLVFCETDTGRISVARQLESQLHIDESIDVVLGLQRFLQCVAFISPGAKTFPKDVLGRNVMLFNNLSAFFSA